MMYYARHRGTRTPVIQTNPDYVPWYLQEQLIWAPSAGSITPTSGPPNDTGISEIPQECYSSFWEQIHSCLRPGLYWVPVVPSLRDMPPQALFWSPQSCRPLRYYRAQLLEWGGCDNTPGCSLSSFAPLPPFQVSSSGPSAPLSPNKHYRSYPSRLLLLITCYFNRHETSRITELVGGY